ncbi:hypothetical protein [Roseomonas genomospecies 6]|uniref:hypothetical protein n=1 Tax=Roseomonas genomospecies 6 TaxID=214106 RepID=UPI0011F1F93F|nr:hypothetical protein [Roseomonas genomospecies 6]
MKKQDKTLIWTPSDIEFSSRNYSLKSTTQPVTKRVIDGHSEEFYPTPPWATLALLDYEKFTGEIWECACGDGAMSQALEQHGHNVFSSDKFDRGFGTPGIDFLTENRVSDNIITNPPYNLAGEFVLHGLRKCRYKLALLLRLAFLEGNERFRRIFDPTPPSRVWVFSERITFYPKNAERKGSGTTAYAWLVWDKECTGESRIGWISPGHKNQS